MGTPASRKAVTTSSSSTAAAAAAASPLLGAFSFEVHGKVSVKIKIKNNKMYRKLTVELGC
jgi:hypothetical protein